MIRRNNPSLYLKKSKTGQLDQAARSFFHIDFVVYINLITKMTRNPIYRLYSVCNLRQDFQDLKLENMFSFF